MLLMQNLATPSRLVFRSRHNFGQDSEQDLKLEHLESINLVLCFRLTVNQYKTDLHHAVTSVTSKGPGFESSTSLVLGNYSKTRYEMTKESVLFLHAYLMTDIKNYKSFFHFNMNAYKSVFNIVIRVVLLGGAAR